MVKNSGFVGGFSAASIVLSLLILTTYRDQSLDNSQKLKTIKDPQWRSYKAIHMLEIHATEDVYRYEIFKKNLQFIRSHNSDKFSVALNEYAHLTTEEFVRMRTGRLKSIKTSSKADPTYVSLKESFDWRDRNVVTPVKDQKNCASSWAFAAVGALESLLIIYKNKREILSEHELIDCSLNYGNQGCNGGFSYQAYDFVKENGIGSYSKKENIMNSGKCQHNPQKILTKISGYRQIVEGDEADLCSALISIGPVTVSINVSHRAFQFYKSGEFDELLCDSTDLNHEALLVGYTKEHYILKNSWGESWGMSGYFLLPRYKNNACGIASHATVPLP